MQTREVSLAEEGVKLERELDDNLSDKKRRLRGAEENLSNKKRRLVELERELDDVLVEVDSLYGDLIRDLVGDGGDVDAQATGVSEQPDVDEPANSGVSEQPDKPDDPGSDVDEPANGGVAEQPDTAGQSVDDSEGRSQATLELGNA